MDLTAYWVASGASIGTGLHSYVARWKITSALPWMRYYHTRNLPDGRKRYEIPFGDDDIRLDLPGCDDPVGLEMVYDWVYSCRSLHEKTQLALLETEKARLEGLWLEAPTNSMHDRLKADLVAVDAEVLTLATWHGGQGQIAA